MEDAKLVKMSKDLKLMEDEVLDDFIDLKEAEGMTPKAKRADGLVNQLARTIVAVEKLRLEK